MVCLRRRAARWQSSGSLITLDFVACARQSPHGVVGWGSERMAELSYLHPGGKAEQLLAVAGDSFLRCAGSWCTVLLLC